MSDPLSTANAMVTSRTYNSYGNLLTMTEGGILTAYTYDSEWLCPVTVSQAGRETIRECDRPTGLVKKLTEVDPNYPAQARWRETSYDVLGRPLTVTEGSGTEASGTVVVIKTTTTSYNDASRTVITISPLDAGVSLTRIQVYDELGRLYQAQEPDDNGQVNLLTDYRYKVTTGASYELVSNPYCGSTNQYCQAAARGWRRTQRDQNGRVREVEWFSGEALPFPLGSNTDSTGVSTSSYTAERVTLTDEIGATRRQRMDGLGRLAEVVEVGAAEWSTLYTYDAADRLTGVTQGTQVRSFVYDTLGRLRGATNPENGTVSYTYHPTHGNLLTRTDARGVVTTYSYDDPLYRLTGTSYSDGQTPAVTYRYDTAESGEAAVAFGWGRLISVGSAVSRTRYDNYDALGRVTRSTQRGAVGSPSYSFTYTYNLADGLKEQVYPSGRKVTWQYNAGGRVSGVGGVKAAVPTVYAIELAYWAHGAGRSLTLGNGVVETTAYNGRLQMQALTAARTTPSLLELQYGYQWSGSCNGGRAVCNNGNVASQTIQGGGLTLVQSYRYDGLNRLTVAGENASNPADCALGSSAWCRKQGLNRWGNTWVEYNSAAPLSALTPTSEGWIEAGTNHLTNAGLGIGYTGGNLTQLAGYSFTYDGENRLKASVLNGVTTGYEYDGLGRRVKKVEAGQTTVYVYDAQGRLAAEYGGAGEAALCTTCWATVDALGSTRMLTNGAGAAVRRHDYLPYGEEIPAGVGGRTEAMGYPAATASADGYPLFTGKERDSETGLDYFGARYYSGAQGRFTSPDAPFADQSPADPQSWNMYAYAVNNPLAYTDPDGRDALAVKFGTGAHGLGHSGIASLHRNDGKGRFADFQPLHAGSAHDVGLYTFNDIAVTYGSDGRPTNESLVAVANQLADAEGVPRDSVSVAYFKTSDAETAALDGYIANAFMLQQQGKTPDYWVGLRDCIAFTMNGLNLAGKSTGVFPLTIPNLQFIDFMLRADWSATGTKPDPEKDRKPPHPRKLIPRCQQEGTCEE